MLDLAFIRNHPDIVKEAARVKYNPIDIDYLLEVDRQVLELQRQVEEARAEQNRISKRIPEAGKDKARSEEHTSELQSRQYLVCRLLLEPYSDHRHLHSFPTRRSSDLLYSQPSRHRKRSSAGQIQPH